jgi:hypothetical protein
MTYKNIDVIQEFVNYGDNESVRAGSLYFKKDVLFSYGVHYPLCIRLKDGFIINKSGYSMTTSTHTNMLIREISECNNLKELGKKQDESIQLKTTSEMLDLLKFNLTDFRFISVCELDKLRILKEIS